MTNTNIPELYSVNSSRVPSNMSGIRVMLQPSPLFTIVNKTVNCNSPIHFSVGLSGNHLTTLDVYLSCQMVLINSHQGT
jgi:hypothetical protein